MALTFLLDLDLLTGPRTAANLRRWHVAVAISSLEKQEDEKEQKQQADPEQHQRAAVTSPDGVFTPSSESAGTQ